MPEDQRYDSRPHFVIPYWTATGPGTTADDGDTRPLPGQVIWYLCPAIHASPYTPGEQLDVTVEVGNFGGANTPSIAQVTVWWSEPASGFAIGPDKFVGYSTVEVDGGGDIAPSPVMSKVIPATAPPHICLLARVSHQYDRAGTLADPVNDRHWAQRNLAAVTVQPGAPFVLDFFAGNPLGEEAEFVLAVRPASEERFRNLAGELHAEPVYTDARVTLAAADGGEPGEGANTMRVVLEAGERRPMQVRLDVPAPVGRGQFAPFEVEQRRGPEGEIVGGLGLIVTTD